MWASARPTWERWAGGDAVEVGEEGAGGGVWGSGGGGVGEGGVWQGRRRGRGGGDAAEAVWVERSMVGLFGNGMVGMVVRGVWQRRRRWRRRVDLPEPEGPVRRRIWPGDGGSCAKGEEALADKPPVAQEASVGSGR